MMTNYLSWRFDCTNLLMKASLHSRTHTQDDDKLSQLAFWLYQPSHEGFLTFSYTYSWWWQTISAGVLTVPAFSWRLPYILVHILKMMTNYLSWRSDCTNLLMKASLHSHTHTQDDDKLSKLAFWLYQPKHNLCYVRINHSDWHVFEQKCLATMSSTLNWFKDPGA